MPGFACIICKGFETCFGIERRDFTIHVHSYNAFITWCSVQKSFFMLWENVWSFCQKKIIKLTKTCHSLYFDDFLIVAMFLCDIIGVVMRFFMAQFGCRWSVILGGLISALGLSMGMVVTEIYQVYLTFGVLTGKISVSWSCQKLIIYHQKKKFLLGGEGRVLLTLKFFKWKQFPVVPFII